MKMNSRNCGQKALHGVEQESRAQPATLVSRCKASAPAAGRAAPVKQAAARSQESPERLQREPPKEPSSGSHAPSQEQALLGGQDAPHLGSPASIALLRECGEGVRRGQAQEDKPQPTHMRRMDKVSLHKSRTLSPLQTREWEASAMNSYQSVPVLPSNGGCHSAELGACEVGRWAEVQVVV